MHLHETLQEEIYTTPFLYKRVTFVGQEYIKMNIKVNPFIYCGGCRKEHTLDKVEPVEDLPYNERATQLVYYCPKAQDTFISMIYNENKRYHTVTNL